MRIRLCKIDGARIHLLRKESFRHCTRRERTEHNAVIRDGCAVITRNIVDRRILRNGSFHPGDDRVLRDERRAAGTRDKFLAKRNTVDRRKADVRTVVGGLYLVGIVGRERDRIIIPSKFGQAAIRVNFLVDFTHLRSFALLRQSVESCDGITAVCMRRYRLDAEHIPFPFQSDIGICRIFLRASKRDGDPGIAVVPRKIGKIADRLGMIVLARIRRHAVLVFVLDVDSRSLPGRRHDADLKMIVGIGRGSHLKGKAPLFDAVAQKREIELRIA